MIRQVLTRVAVHRSPWISWDNGIVRDVQQTTLLCLTIGNTVHAPHQPNAPVLMMPKPGEDERAQFADSYNAAGR